MHNDSARNNDVSKKQNMTETVEQPIQVDEGAYSVKIAHVEASLKKAVAALDTPSAEQEGEPVPVPAPQPDVIPLPTPEPVEEPSPEEIPDLTPTPDIPNLPNIPPAKMNK